MSAKQPSLADARPLFGLRRGAINEVVAFGCSAFKVQGHAAASAYLNMPLVARSLLKPWQLLAAHVVRDDKNVAVCMASHSGQQMHLEALGTLMRELKITETQFQCPSSFPMDRQVMADMKQRGIAKNPLYHPCSGKHLALLWACQQQRWDLATYMNPTHPYHQALLKTLAAFGAKSVTWETDSCGLPTAVLPLGEHLQLWENLATSTASDAQTLRKLWVANPELVGGAGRLDSALVEVGAGTIMAKEGADGLLMVQSIPQNREKSQSALIKNASGYDSGFLALALYALLLDNRPALNAPMGKVLEYLAGRLSDWVPCDQTLVRPAEI